MTVFAAMLATLFADPNMAADAVYTPPGGGAGTPCRAIVRQPDRSFAFHEVGVTLPARIAEVRVAEVTAPEEGGTLTVAGTPCRVTRVTQTDLDRALWRLELQ